ncbi:hypothetical protein IEQ34_022086 [Dendrobium chrysotoxum]|uniref:Uncharacterized protein n=1 Tax=Dendrobium chrysotoxum TaxID=161865 RepID=A0AAV7FW83_DENCH|nr:hypothetical protein IEQ34_022086 [Dendrobium chrysotoxum]
MQSSFASLELNLRREVAVNEDLNFLLEALMRDEKYVIVTDRWQKFSNLSMDEENLAFLASFADEFLVHGVDMEGKRYSNLLSFLFSIMLRFSLSDT